MSDEHAVETFDDASRSELERMWRSARGAAVPTILLAGLVGAAATVSTSFDVGPCRAPACAAKPFR